MYTVMYIVNFNWLRVLVALRPLVLYHKAINNNNNNNSWNKKQLISRYFEELFYL